jgi:hypothetical protein
MWSLLDVLVGRAPADEPSGHVTDREGNLEVTGNRLEIVFHARRRDLRTQVGAHRFGRERLNFVAERLIEHWLHARAPTHAAGLFQGHVFEL